MWLDLLRLLAGGVGLYFGAEWLVRGAAGLARAFGVRPLVIGLTVVAYGTSAPELAVSLVGAWEGQGALVVGNVVGSNIANLGIVLGICALIAPPLVEGTMIRREVPVLIGATAATLAILLDGVIGRFEALLLLLGAVGFTVRTLRGAAALPEQPGEAAAEGENQPVTRSRPTLAGIALVGLGVLVAAGDLFVTGATGIATAFGMSERLIGLTIVALGTSLPEMAACVVAALRGHSDLAVGNVVGSNIFNVLLILGAAGMLRPIAVPFESVRFDLVVLLVLTLTGALLLRTARRITRVEGGVLISCYFAFLGYLAVGG